MRRWMIVGSALVVAAFALPALAHNISSSITVKYPYFTGDRLRFDTVHKITGCVNNGDGETCAQGVDFRAESSCQFSALNQWNSCGDTSLSSTRHWPDYTQVTAVHWLTCASNPRDVTVRTVGRGWLRHLGAWYATPWYTSLSRTVRCG